MEVSALRYSGGVGLHGRSPLLRLQSDERLIALVRRGSTAAFEVLVGRYHSRLLAFCRHLLGSREDAEDVLQEVLAAAYNAMIADDRAINVRPWLYRIARNRCLNHLRRAQAIGVDSMDIHLSDHGASTADKVHLAEEFRMLVDDIQALPETQRTALVLREMDALSYEQIAEAMETTVPSVKSLLVRARVSLAEAAEARMLSCAEVRIELAEVAEGLLPKPSAPVRRHLRSCQRCRGFQVEMKRTSKALAALLPLGPLALLKQLVVAQLGHSAGASAGAGTGASGAAGTGAALGTGAMAGGAFAGAGGSSFVPLGVGALATKAAAGLAAAALVTAGAVEVTHTAPRPAAHHHPAALAVVSHPASVPAVQPAVVTHTLEASTGGTAALLIAGHKRHHARHAVLKALDAKPKAEPVKLTLTTASVKPDAKLKDKAQKAKPPGTTQSESVPTVLTTTDPTTQASASPSSSSSSTPAAAPMDSPGAASTGSSSSSSAPPSDSSTTSSSTTAPTTTSSSSTTTTTTATSPSSGTTTTSGTDSSPSSGSTTGSGTGSGSGSSDSTGSGSGTTGGTGASTGGTSGTPAPDGDTGGGSSPAPTNGPPAS